MKRMVGKTVMVTGATSGMGRASAIMFAQEGAEVILIGRDEQRGNEVVAKIEEMGEKAKLYLCDISIEKNVEELSRPGHLNGDAEHKHALISSIVGVGDMVGENAGTVLRHAMNLFPLFRRRSFFFQIIYVTVVHANNQIKIIKVLCPYRA